LAAVRAFVDLQCFDGHWEWHDAFYAFFTSEIVVMKNAGAQEDSLLATVLVLAWLKTSAVQYFDLWEMVADKGDGWLLTKNNFEQLMNTAMNAIKDRTWDLEAVFSVQRVQIRGKRLVGWVQRVTTSGVEEELGITMGHGSRIWCWKGWLGLPTKLFDCSLQMRWRGREAERHAPD
jgi:hypothetical protein